MSRLGCTQPLGDAQIFENIYGYVFNYIGSDIANRGCCLGKGCNLHAFCMHLCLSLLCYRIRRESNIWQNSAKHILAD